MWPRGSRKDELIDKLVQLANGDVDLVQRAIREASARGSGSADLERIVDYIVKHRMVEREREVA